MDMTTRIQVAVVHADMAIVAFLRRLPSIVLGLVLRLARGRLLDAFPACRFRHVDEEPDRHASRLQDLQSPNTEPLRFDGGLGERENGVFQCVC